MSDDHLLSLSSCDFVGDFGCTEPTCERCHAPLTDDFDIQAGGHGMSLAEVCELYSIDGDAVVSALLKKLATRDSDFAALAAKYEEAQKRLNSALHQLEAGQREPQVMHVSPERQAVIDAWLVKTGQVKL